MAILFPDVFPLWRNVMLSLNIVMQRYYCYYWYYYCYLYSQFFMCIYCASNEQCCPSSIQANANFAFCQILTDKSQYWHLIWTKSDRYSSTFLFLECRRAIRVLIPWKLTVSARKLALLVQTNSPVAQCSKFLSCAHALWGRSRNGWRVGRVSQDIGYRG